MKKAVKNKHKLYMKYRRTQRYKDYQEYAEQMKKTKKVVEKAHADYEGKLMREFKSKPKQLFNVRSKQKVKVGVSRLERDDGELTETDEEAANVLNKFFESVYSRARRGCTSTTCKKRRYSTMGLM